MTRADTCLAARVSLLSPDNNITGMSGVKSPLRHVSQSCSNTRVIISFELPRRDCLLNSAFNEKRNWPIEIWRVIETDVFANGQLLKDAVH